MRGDTFITFRGEADVLIEYDVDMSGPGSGVEVQWWFFEKRPEGEAPVTQEEDDAIAGLAIDAAGSLAESFWDD